MKKSLLSGLYALALLFIISISISLVPAQAMSFSPNPARVNATLTVSDVPSGSTVQFILNNGTPVFAGDASGTAKYLPLLEGNLRIFVTQGGIPVDDKIIAVMPELIPTPTATATATATATTPTPSGAGKSTGSGGVITNEPLDNILKYQTVEGTLIANISTVFSFTMPELAIYQVVITGTENQNELTAIRVELLNGTSKHVNASAPGTVYANQNVWSGTKDIGDVLIRFRVNNSWIDNNSIVRSNIQLLQWSDGNWKKLETSQINKNDTYTYFESKTTGLSQSQFAISGMTAAAQTPFKPQVTVTTVTTPSATVKTPTEAETPLPTKAPGFESVLAVLSLALLAIYRFIVRGKKL